MTMKSITTSLVVAAIAGASILLTSATTFAGGPLNLNLNDPDGVERWPNGGAAIPYNPDLGGLGPLANAQAVAQTTASFQAWENITTATATYSNNGFMPFDVDETNFAPFIQNLFFGTNISDGLSPVVYDEDGAIFLALFGPSGVLGFASTDTRDANGTPIEAVAFLNGGAILGGFPVADFFGVQVHEYGHYSGLAHTVTNGENLLLADESGPTPFNTYGNAVVDDVETMYPFANAGIGEETPHADDIGIFSFLYPSAGFFAGSGTIDGTILASNGTTPLTGINVIARNVNDPFEDAVSAIAGDRGVTGEYTINGLTPGASYTVHIDQILAGGFSTSPIALPGPEEFYNGANESNNTILPDNPNESVNVASVAGMPTTGIDVISNSFAPGDPLPVGDDGFVELFMPFTYEICGQEFDSVFVNANGNLTFGAGDGDFTESAAQMLSGPPRIAALWDDLSPFNLFTGAQQGLVTFDQTGNTFTVIFEDVPEFLNTGSNSFETTLHRSSNHVDVDYGDLTAADGLAGVSCGGAITSRFEAAIDLSNFTPSRINLKNQPAVYEVFGFGMPNDSANSTVRFNGTTNYNDNWAEPNDSFKKARNVSLPFDSIDVVRFTEIEPAAGDVDYFAFGANGGTSLVVEVLTGQIDSLVCLFGPDGALLDVDDDGGAGLLSRIVFPLPEDGKYRVAITTFPDFDCSGDGNTDPSFGQGRYVLDLVTVSGTLLDLGDDDFEELALDFSFPYQGANYNSVFVNSNGNLTFGSGDPDFSESVTDFLSGPPRIAPLWDDLNPSSGGLIIADGDSSSMTVSFVGVPEFFATGANTFSVTMNADGTINIGYAGVSATDGIVGVTPGSNIAGGPGAVDLSTSATWSATGSTYEQFSFGNPFDLDLSAQDYIP